ncbi:MAG: UDP-3-O-(3-hydroxymyristoyl)glucosamine N-acyltransferase [Bacteroidales bacterium]|nr:UDP-3-O-(3-hydroxymyristoyl)glucosamine N-acyltransferase [Bacteroidales bacterium]
MFTVRQLAEQVRGEVLGDGDVLISNARTLFEAATGDITFVESERYRSVWENSPAAAAIVNAAIPINGRPLIRVADPLSAFATILLNFRKPTTPPVAGHIHPSACVHPSAQIGTGSSIAPFAVIGEGAEIGARCLIHSGVAIGRNCRLGDDVVIYPNTVLYDNCQLGNRVIIHAGCVLGADGFGYRVQNGRHVKVPQLGTLEIGDDVEIGASTTIDRGTFGPTRIGEGTKIDNLVMIGHNCQIGRHNLFASQVGIAGSCTTGDYVVMAGQVGIADHRTIGAGAILGAKTGVVRDIPGGTRMLGLPAKPDRVEMRIWNFHEKLPQFLKDLRRIKKHLGLEDRE